MSLQKSSSCSSLDRSSVGNQQGFNNYLTVHVCNLIITLNICPIMVSIFNIFRAFHPRLPLYQRSQRRIASTIWLISSNRIRIVAAILSLIWSLRQVPPPCRFTPTIITLTTRLPLPRNNPTKRLVGPR